MRGGGHLEAIEHGRYLGRPDLVTIRCLVSKKLPWLHLLPQLTFPGLRLRVVSGYIYTSRQPGRPSLFHHIWSWWMHLVYSATAVRLSQTRGTRFPEKWREVIL